MSNTKTLSNGLAQYPPHVLREYALLADGERGILVGPRGEFAWMCAPHWHSDAVFSSLIGGDGLYAVTPSERRFVWGGHYEDGSLIWRSRWVTTDSVIECREALAFPGRSETAVVLRRIIATEAAARVRVTLDARASFGRHPMRDVTHQDGVFTARTGPLYLRWSGAAGARGSNNGALVLDLELDPGSHLDLVLEVSERPLPHEEIEPDVAWRSTEDAWSDAMPPMDDTLAPRDARHAYAVLRG
ncbi:MAG: trehalase-like domain-containing protein, partial [Acidimicrobiales bacterium]